MLVATKPKVVPNNKMKVVKKTKKKMTAAQDAAYDRKHGIKAGSKEDQAMDQKNGVSYKKKAKSKKKIDMSTISGHNSAKQNGGSESKLNKGKNAGQKAYLKRVGTKGMQC